jgi:hypothetical protein
MWTEQEDVPGMLVFHLWDMSYPQPHGTFLYLSFHYFTSFPEGSSCGPDSLFIITYKHCFIKVKTENFPFSWWSRHWRDMGKESVAPQTLNSALGRSDLSALYGDCCTSEGNSPQYSLDKRQCGPQSHSAIWGGDEKVCCYQKLNLISKTIVPIVYHYTNWTIPAL